MSYRPLPLVGAAIIPLVASCAISSPSRPIAEGTDMSSSSQSSQWRISSDGRPLEAVFGQQTVVLGNFAGQLGVYPDGGISLHVGESLSLRKRVQNVNWPPFYSSDADVLAAVATIGDSAASFRALKPGRAQILVFTPFCHGVDHSDASAPCTVVPVRVV